LSDIYEKLAILSDSAKYDVSCSSSGSDNNYKTGELGACHSSGICHTFTSDGRCVSLLKVLFTNHCIYDCSYCVNRVSNDIKREAFTPRQLADLTINFYKRNYIEGLFLSSGIVKDEDYTMTLIINALKILRYEYKFNGYIHTKLIPNADNSLVEEVIRLSNRVSSNIELPSNKSLMLLAPDKNKTSVLKPLNFAKNFSLEKSNKPISMSTQMIIGATPESDNQILKLSQNLYQKGLLKRVYYSAYIPVNSHKNLPVIDTAPPLLREHRLYQADWLLRFYGFSYDEILDVDEDLDLELDPKVIWALKNIQLFPMEINKIDFEMLIKVPGIGVRGAQKIIKARRFKKLNFDDLKKLRVSVKRAKYFITCNGKYQKDVKMYQENIKDALLEKNKPKQLTFDFSAISGEI
jgi:putative DNA modification/repair radical SAM protein